MIVGINIVYAANSQDVIKLQGQLKKEGYTVPITVLNQYPELVQLIQGSASMKKETKQHWMITLPKITAEQRNRLYHILATEKRRIAEINTQQEKLNKIKNSDQAVKITEQEILKIIALNAKRTRFNMKKDPIEIQMNLKQEGYMVAKETVVHYPELVKLIYNSESFDKEQKKYWFNLLPQMSHKNRTQLYKILVEEHKKMEKLEDEYVSKLQEIIKKNKS